MAKAVQALAYTTLGAGYALECFNVNHTVISIALAIAYLVIALKYLRDALKDQN